MLRPAEGWHGYPRTVARPAATGGDLGGGPALETPSGADCWVGAEPTAVGPGSGRGWPDSVGGQASGDDTRANSNRRSGPGRPHLGRWKRGSDSDHRSCTVCGGVMPSKRVEVLTFVAAHHECFVGDTCSFLRSSFLFHHFNRQ